MDRHAWSSYRTRPSPPPFSAWHITPGCIGDGRGERGGKGVVNNTYVSQSILMIGFCLHARRLESSLDGNVYNGFRCRDNNNLVTHTHTFRFMSLLLLLLPWYQCFSFFSFGFFFVFGFFFIFLLLCLFECFKFLSHRFLLIFLIFLRFLLVSPIFLLRFFLILLFFLLLPFLLISLIFRFRSLIFFSYCWLFFWTLSHSLLFSSFSAHLPSIFLFLLFFFLFPSSSFFNYVINATLDGIKSRASNLSRYQEKNS